MSHPEHCCEVEPAWWEEQLKCQSSGKTFYESRLRFILEHHNFAQREQLLGMVMSAAMGDRTLTVSELMSVLSMIEEAHHKSLEVNYNEGWKV